MDILLAELESGNTQSALIHFETGSATPEAFRLCAALRDIARASIRRGRSAIMPTTWPASQGEYTEGAVPAARENAPDVLPGYRVCIAMVLYVLVVYVVQI
jgi:hypothetical protein